MTADGMGIGELVDALQRRGERLPFEIGAFVALEACEASLRSPVRLAPEDVRVTGEGQVMISTDAAKAAPGESASSLVSMLARLLVAAGPGVPPNLLRLVEQGTVRDLQRVHDEIEASLIPLNRGASRRVLARLVRESSRPPAPSLATHDDQESEIDLALDEFLGVPTASPESAEVDDPESAGLIGSEFELPLARPTRAQELAPAHDELEPITEAFLRHPELFPPERPLSAELLPERELADPVPARSPDDVDTLDETLDQEETLPGLRRGLGWRWMLWLGALGLVGLVAVLVDRGVVSWPLISATEGKRAAATAARSTPVTVGLGTVNLSVSPPTSQLFLFVGRGPVRISDLSTQSAHEFVAFDTQYRPSRASVPADAEWTDAADGPLYELALQSQPDSSQTTLDVGTPETTPSDEPSGPTGTVRIVTTPRGLKVYRYLGTGAEHTLTGLSPQLGHELLLVHPDHPPSRVVIGPSDWVSDDGDPQVDLTVNLAP